METKSSQQQKSNIASPTTIKVSQKVLDGLNNLRQEQRQLGAKLSDIETDIKEHK